MGSGMATAMLARRVARTMVRRMVEFRWGEVEDERGVDYSGSCFRGNNACGG
jgi:hypothetical protein